MSKEKTFSEIEREMTELFLSDSATQNAIDSTIRHNQKQLFIKLRVLADYFNGENNWVPDNGELAWHVEYDIYREELKTSSNILFRPVLPLFINVLDLEKAIQIIETEFPELIEAFTKSK